jgi:hypothetical protein
LGLFLGNNAIFLISSTCIRGDKEIESINGTACINIYFVFSS